MQSVPGLPAYLECDPDLHKLTAALGVTLHGAFGFAGLGGCVSREPVWGRVAKLATLVMTTADGTVLRLRVQRFVSVLKGACGTKFAGGS